MELSCSADYLTDAKVIKFSFLMTNDSLPRFARVKLEARPVWKPLHLQPVFAECECMGGAVAEELFEYGLCLPSGSNLTEEDLERVTSAILGL